MNYIKASTFRLQYASRLFINKMTTKEATEIIKPVAPELVLLGDIGKPDQKTRSFMKWCDDNYEKVYWVPGYLELSSREKKHTWYDQYSKCKDTIEGLNTILSSKLNVTYKNPNLQLLLTTRWHYEPSVSVYIDDNYGTKIMDEEDYYNMIYSDTKWLIKQTELSKNPVVWLTYSNMFTTLKIQDYNKLLCCIQGRSHYKCSSTYSFGQPLNAVNMGGNKQFLNNAVWEYKG